MDEIKENKMKQLMVIPKDKCVSISPISLPIRLGSLGPHDFFPKLKITIEREMSGCG